MHISIRYAFDVRLMIHSVLTHSYHDTSKLHLKPRGCHYNSLKIAHKVVQLRVQIQEDATHTVAHVYETSI